MTNLSLRGLVLISLSVFLNACLKEPQRHQNSNMGGSKNSVAVLCEGNYLWNNAQLDMYDPDSQWVWSNAFESANNRPLGDVLQSGVYWNNTLWLVVNNSGKMMALNPESLKLKKQIDISKSPRFMTYFDGKIYVSDLESNEISIFDTLTENLRKIPVLPNPSGVRSGWTENILVFQGKIVSAVNDGFLWIYNPQNDSVVLKVAEKGAQLLCLDKQNRLWLAATDKDRSVLTCYDQTFSVQGRYEFPPEEKITRLKASVTGDTLWMLVSSKLQGFDINKPQEMIKRTVPYTMAYGLGVNPYNGDIYLSDAFDYIKKGRVVVLNAQGDSVKNDFFSGIIPSEFVFIRR